MCLVGCWAGFWGRAQAAAWRSRAWASAHSCCHGQPDAMANLIRRTEMWTNAPMPGCAGTSLEELEPDRAAPRFGELRVLEPDPAQGAHQNVGHRGEPQPQLV